MKITKDELQTIIKEELEKLLEMSGEDLKNLPPEALDAPSPENTMAAQQPAAASQPPSLGLNPNEFSKSVQRTTYWMNAAAKQLANINATLPSGKIDQRLIMGAHDTLRNTKKNLDNMLGNLKSLIDALPKK